jgi:leucyl aminopeptidase
MYPEVVNVDAQGRLILADIARMGAVEELALGNDRSGISCRKERMWREFERGRATARDTRWEAECMNRRRSDI